MKRKHVTFVDSGDGLGLVTRQRTYDVFSGVGIVTEDLNRSTLPLQKFGEQNYNYTLLYKALSQIAPKSFNMQLPVIFDNSVQAFVQDKTNLSAEHIEKWFITYKIRSGYYLYLEEGVSKHDFWGNKSGIVTSQELESAKKKQTESQITFADPTYDITFKMLFGNDQHKDILISFLNALLNLEGNNKIVNVQIEREGEAVYGKYGVNSALDVICTTYNGKTIGVEMQRKHEDYFLARTQYYMSKLILKQIQSGFSNQYNEIIYKTYIISIGKDNIFIGKHNLNQGDHFELTVVPTIEELGIEVPDNKMVWKFFELTKFKKFCENKVMSVDDGSSRYLKEQWLKFLAECKDQADVPKHAPEIIKKGFEVMKVAKWPPGQYLAYLDAEVQERFEQKEQENTRIKIAQSEAKGKAEGKAEGKAQTTASIVLKLLDLGLTKEQIITTAGITIEQLKIIQEQEDPSIETVTKLLLEADSTVSGNLNSHEDLSISGDGDAAMGYDY